MFKAEKTLQLIDACMVEDQGARFRTLLKTILPDMSDAYRSEDDEYRRHLGASLIGRECPRELWYGFRWVAKKKFNARILRLFNRGHLEEGRFLALLKMIGCEIWYAKEDGKQYSFSDHNGHFGSSLDCIIRGVPDLAPGIVANGEFKTASDKVFQKVLRNGVKAEKYEHYVQMQMCMLKMELPYSLYMVVNKDNDELHAEIVVFNQAVAKQYLARAGAIILALEPPPQIHPSPGWYGCKWCDFLSVCKKDGKVDKNCRTCSFAQPGVHNSEPWSCWKNNREVINDCEASAKGCDQYVRIPGL